jgi:chromosome segregation ATPase
LSQPDKSKGTQVKKGTKRFEPRETESRIAEVIQARDAAQKQAVSLHNEFKKLSQHAADLEAHLLELDEQLKKAREDGEKARKQAADLEDQLKKAKEDASKARAKAEEQSGRLSEAEGKKLQQERDHAKAESGKARLRAADMERRLHENTAQALKATTLEHEAARLRAQIEDLQKELRRVRDDAGKAGAKAAEIDRRSHDETSTLRKQLEEAREAVLKFQTAQEEAQALAAKRENDAVALRRQVEELQQELKKTREDGASAAARLPELERRLQEEPAALRKQIEEAQEAARKVQAERDQLKEKADKAGAKADEQARGAAGMTEAATALRKRLEDSRAEVKLIQETRQKIEQRAINAEAKAAELDRQVKELSSRVAKGAGLLEEIDRTRRALDDSKTELKKVQETRDKGDQQVRKQLDESRAEVKKLHESRAKADARAAELEQQVKDLTARATKNETAVRRKADEAKQALARTAELEQQVKDLTAQATKSQETSRRKLEETQAEAKKRAAELEQRARELADVQRQLEESRAEAKKLKEGRDKAESQSAEANRYFASMEKGLVEAQEALSKAKEDGAAAVEKLRAENHDLERRLREAEAAKSPAPPAPAPKPPAAPSSIDSLFASAVTEPVPAPPPPPSSASALDSIFDSEPSPPPPPRPKTSVPPLQTVPAGSSSPETTLKPQHAFGPPGEDGQPKYVLHELLPTDEMGVIYRASERANNRQFAVRFLSGQAGEQQTQAIEREVEKLIALPHPNILHVQGSGRRKSRLYLAMDLVQAPTLARAKIHDLKRVCAIVRDVAAAVHYAHEEQIFHGDITPDNIIVAPGDGKGDHALVKDFALGYLIETLILPPPATPKEPRKHVRNLAYLPPEQVDAAKPKLSVAGDVYMLGATLYAALAAKPPFEGKDAAQLRTRVMFSEPAPLNKIRPDVPEAVSTIVRRAMIKESGLRYASAGHIVDALTKFLG